jgi:ATP-binding cassette subfamily B protein
MRLVLINSLFMPTIFILVGLSTILCIYVGGKLAISDTSELGIGDVLSFIFYVNLLTWPFASVGWVISLIQRAAASQERINEFLQVEQEITNTSDAPFAFDHKIEFRDVSYTYPNSGIQAVKNISFTLKKGETLGIIGRTGSGKTTVLQLITRQIEPDSGTVLIDDVPMKDINLNALLDATGVVPQDVFLFSDTIKNNIAFGSRSDEVSDSDIEEVTKMSHVYHNIQDLKDGFDTLLGERGVNLSGGQKQRVSISRALIRKPQLLILDDCLSAVDTETEETILRNLHNMDRVTTLIVSHRVSSIRNAQRIINLSEGTVEEDGTHDELIALNGLYKELYEKQLLEEENKDQE